MIGQTISHYTILEKLGEGGMGVVYKARDTKLDRDVALKFLPAQLASSDADRARFAQEAKAAASLDHPNVCTIFGIEEVDTGGAKGKQFFFAMAFVEGVTLREKMPSLSTKQAIELGVQIADGLAAAHEKGIVHRDIKPENIMVRKDGIVQVMDFGLAKLRASGSRITRLTKAGSTVGTAGYMSPEQVQGQETDHRSDIFSYGVLLYEMLTGQPPFKGVHETALAYEIVNVDPAPMSSIKPDLDPSLDAIVLDCLEKDPKERTQSVAQVSLELKRYRRESSRQRASRVTAAMPAVSGQHRPEAPGAAGATAAVPKAPRLPWAIAAVAVIASLVMGYLRFTGGESLPPVIHSSIVPAANSFLGSAGSLALSPDGTILAYVAGDSANGPRLWLRTLKSASASPLSATRGAFAPFWSPDGRYIGFFADGALKKVEAGSGTVTTICDADLPSGGSWNDRGTIIFTSLNHAGIFRVAAQGGSPELFAGKDSSQEDIAYSAPWFLPDGERFLYSVNNRYMVVTTDRDQGGVFISSLGSDERRKLLDVSSNAMTASGYLLYVTGNNLVAAKFDLGAGEVTGDPATIAGRVSYLDRTGTGNFSVSQNGILIYQTMSQEYSDFLTLYDRKGNVLKHVGDEAIHDDPVFSPDGRRVAFTLYSGTGERGVARGDIWIAEPGRGAVSRFTFSPEEEDDPVWTPDGENIVYSDVGEIAMKPASGIGEKRVLYRSKSDKVPTDVSRDGRYLLFCDFGTKTGRDIWALPLEGDAKPVPVATTEFNELSGHFSPDGKLIAYASNETGRMEVYIRSFPSTSGKWQISTQGGAVPQWDRSGTTLYYVDAEGRMTVIPITVTGNSVQAGTPVSLFRTKLLRTNTPGHIYDVSPDGSTFIILDEQWTDDRAEPIDLIVNWTSGLEQH